MNTSANRVMNGVLTGMLLIAVPALSVRAQSSAAPDAELKKLANEFTEAWAKGDGRALAALYTPDAVRLPGDGQVISGRAAIEQNHSQALAGPFKGSTITIAPGQTRQLSSDVAVGEGRFEVKAGTPPPGVPTSGQYLNTYVRQGGRWLIASSAVMPAQAR